MTNNYEWLSLLHFNSTNNSTTFTDECGRPWTGNGDARIKTAASKFGSSSLLGTANSAGGVTATLDSAYFQPGLPATVDCWLKTSTATQYSCLFSANSGAAGMELLLNIDAANDGKFAVYNTVAGTPHLKSSGGFNDGDWHHVALVYNPFSADNTRYWQLFVDGHEEAISNVQNSVQVCSSTEIGGSSSNSRGMVGYIDEFAWRMGAIWTADFTPPTAAYTITAPTATTVRTVPTLPRRVP